MLEFRALAERVRVCQERLEKQEQALEDVSHVIHSEIIPPSQSKLWFYELQTTPIRKFFFLTLLFVEIKGMWSANGS